MRSFASRLLVGLSAVLVAGSFAVAAPEATDSKAPVAVKACQLPPGTIAGSVVGSDRIAPKERLDVALFDAKSKEKVASTRTDLRGEFEMANVSEGSYVLRVGTPGAHMPLDVVAGAKSGRLSIMMPSVATMPVANSQGHGELFTGLGLGGMLLIGGVGATGGILVLNNNTNMFGRGGLFNEGGKKNPVSPTKP